MPFFTFRQNNSGGGFDQDEDVDVTVIVEAPNAVAANALAKTHGIYFNGCERGMDCECCGDRWSPMWSDIEGTAEPEIYGSKIGDPEFISRATSYGGRAIIYHLSGVRRYVAKMGD